MALELEGGLLGVIKALISRPDQDPAAPVWLCNLGKVNNILMPTFPSCKRKGMLFPCCRGALEINLLSETGGEYGENVHVDQVPSPRHRAVFSRQHMVLKIPQNIIHASRQSQQASPLLPEHTLSAAALGNVHISLPVA